MANPPTEVTLSYPAPYIKEPATLLSKTDEGNSSVFYRCGDAGFSKAPRDFFSTGDFKIREMPWTAVKPESCCTSVLASPPDYTSIVGYLSYEAGYFYERRWQDLQPPQTGYAWRFLEVPVWYEADHETQTGTIRTARNCDPKAIAHLIDVLKQVDDKPQPTSQRSAMESFAIEVGKYGELSESAYAGIVSRILEDIASGRYYELNFTQRFRMTSWRHPLDCFQSVFQKYQPRRAFYAQFRDEIIASCSPELFLQKHGTRISTRPIKGSRAEQGSPQEYEKLRAEHIMVVDLARNDIGRVSNLGWVDVPELAKENEFGGLKHLESLVVGETSLRWLDLLPHTYPAASITGAPKVEVVKAIAEYEQSRRGVYTGSCGWVLPDGNFDFNVAIRTLTAIKDADIWRYEIGAGGAIIADSDPRQEYEECLRKAAPLVSAIADGE